MCNSARRLMGSRILESDIANPDVPKHHTKNQCYQQVMTITFILAQSDHNKRRPMYISHMNR